jgi:hypothetical protein
MLSGLRVEGNKPTGMRRCRLCRFVKEGLVAHEQRILHYEDCCLLNIGAETFCKILRNLSNIRYSVPVLEATSAIVATAALRKKCYARR